jgi:uncharacterized protein YgiM (DUF1202 family)
MNANAFLQKDYENETTFRPKKTNPIQSQFQTAHLLVNRMSKVRCQIICSLFSVLCYLSSAFCLLSMAAAIFNQIKKLTITRTGANLKSRRVICGFESLLTWGIGTYFLGDIKMQSYIKLFAIVILTSLVSVGFAQEAATPTSGTDEAGAPAFPYMAEITGDNVYIRSGPGTNFYYCGKLNKGDKVKVIGKQFSWARVVPPAGSFSWISMQYVSIDPDNPTVGSVTGDRVRVYAGSDFIKTLHSKTLQGKLDQGNKVKLLGEQMDDYYKIAPPSFSYLWVSINFTKPLKQVIEVAPTIEPPIIKPTTEPNEVVPEPVSPEAALEIYSALKEQFDTERAKPIDQQNYADIKEALIKIAGNKTADKAARYAEFVLNQIKDFELVLEVAKAVRLQNVQLQKIRERIDKARATKLAEFQDLGRFAVVGKLQTFTTYGPGHYRIIDKSGKTICYALPSPQVSKMQLSKLIDRKVGLLGTIEPHRQTAGALVRFTKVVELD